MSERARTALIRLINEDSTLVGEAQRCKNLLGDDLRGEFRKEVNALGEAVRSGAVQLLASHAQLTIWVRLERAAAKLHEETGITDNLALWAVESWALALGLVATDQLPPRAAPPAEGRRPHAPEPPRHEQGPTEAELARLRREGEVRLASLLREIYDRTGGRPTQADTDAFNVMRREYKVASETARELGRQAQGEWQAEQDRRRRLAEEQRRQREANAADKLSDTPRSRKEQQMAQLYEQLGREEAERRWAEEVEARWLGNAEAVGILGNLFVPAMTREFRQIKSNGVLLVGGTVGKTYLASSLAWLAAGYVELPYVEGEGRPRTAEDLFRELGDAFRDGPKASAEWARQGRGWEPISLVEVAPRRFKVPPCVVFIGECHELPKGGQWLLKPTDPDDRTMILADGRAVDTSNVFFMLGTTNPKMLAPALLSRLQVVSLKSPVKRGRSESCMPAWDGCGPCGKCQTVINMKFDNAVCPICGHRMSWQEAFQVCGSYHGTLPPDVYSERDF